MDLVTAVLEQPPTLLLGLHFICRMIVWPNNFDLFLVIRLYIIMASHQLTVLDYIIIK